MKSNTVCGFQLDAVVAGVVHPRSTRRGKTRFVVSGFNRADGSPIRFKSLEKAERHIRNVARTAVAQWEAKQTSSEVK